MLHRFATIAAVCMLVPWGTAPLALADPPDDAAVPPAQPVAAVDPGPPPDTGVVASEVPGIAHTPDGRTLTVAAKDETQLPVAPLTTSLSSREWLVGATFTGAGMASVSGGTLEVGYQIGCGIEMDKVKLNGSIGIGAGSLSLNPTAAARLASARSPFRSRARSRSNPGPAPSPMSRSTRRRSRAIRRASR